MSKSFSKQLRVEKVPKKKKKKIHHLGDLQIVNIHSLDTPTVYSIEVLIAA